MAKPGISVKIRDEKQVRETIGKDIPDFTRFAVANTGSRVAFLGLEKSEDHMRHIFNLRNKFIVSSAPGKGALKFNRAIPHHDLDKIVSSWGSPDKIGSRDYSFLEDQEEGFTNTGAVPTKQARIAKSEKKRIRRVNYMNKMTVMKLSDGPSATNKLGARIAFFKMAFSEGFGFPGSNQFFYIKDGEYLPGWSAGFYQFSRKNTPGPDFQYPNIRRLYYTGSDVRKRRRATHWMQISKNKITQRDIEKIYEKEFNQAFTRGIKRRW